MVSNAVCPPLLDVILYITEIRTPFDFHSPFIRAQFHARKPIRLSVPPNVLSKEPHLEIDEIEVNFVKRTRSVSYFNGCHHSPAAYWHNALRREIGRPTRARTCREFPGK